MRGNSLKHLGVTRQAAVRVFWACMVIIHAPVLITALRSCLASGGDPRGLGTCIALTLSMVFFALKFRGASFLRFQAAPRSWVAALLVLSLVHVNKLGPDVGAMAAPECAAVIATTALAGRLICEHWRRVLVSPYARPDLSGRSSVARSHEVVWGDEFRPHCWVLSSRLYSLRAPPV